MWPHGFCKKLISSNVVNSNRFIFIDALPIKTEVNVVFTLSWIFGGVVNELRSG